MKRRYHLTGVDLLRFWTIMETLKALPLEVKPLHLHRFAELPIFDNHHCPFNRVLVAQTRSERLTLVGGDRRFPCTLASNSYGTKTFQSRQRVKSCYLFGRKSVPLRNPA